MKIEVVICDDDFARIVRAIIEQVHPMLPRSVASIALAGDSSRAVNPVEKREEQQDRQRVLPPAGYIRLKEILSLIPVSKSTWWAGVREGRFPQPTKKFGRRVSAWSVHDIRRLIEEPEPGVKGGVLSA